MKKTICIVVFYFVSMCAFAGGYPSDKVSSVIPYNLKSKLPVITNLKNIKWHRVSKYKEVAVVMGDPTKAGPFVILGKDYPGFEKAPHYHTGFAVITVLSGSYHRSFSTVLNKHGKYNYILKKGTVSINPAYAIHSEWVTKPVIVEIFAIGPWTTTYVDKHGNPLPMKDVKNANPSMTML